MKNIVLLSWLLSISQFGKAQFVEILEEVNNTNVSLQYGYIYSYLQTKVTPDQVEYTKPSPGYSLGIIYENIFNRYFSVQTGINYFSIDYGKEEQKKSEYNFHIDNIYIPITAVLNTDFCDQFSYSIFGGVQVGYNIHSEMGEVGFTNTKKSDGAFVDVKPFDIAATYGANAEICVNKKRTLKLIFGGRGSYGFIDISENSLEGNNQFNVIPENTTIKIFGGFAGLKFVIYL